MTYLSRHSDLRAKERELGIPLVCDFDDPAAKGGRGWTPHVQPAKPDGLDTAKLAAEAAEIIQAARREREWELDTEHRS